MRLARAERAVDEAADVAVVVETGADGREHIVEPREDLLADDEVAERTAHAIGRVVDLGDEVVLIGALGLLEIVVDTHDSGLLRARGWRGDIGLLAAATAGLEVASGDEVVEHAGEQSRVAGPLAGELGQGGAAVAE